MMMEYLMAEAGIRQLHARYIDAAWRKDAEAFANCFTEDGEWKIATLHMRGRAELGATFARLLGGCARVQMILGMPLLDIGEGTATGRINVTELAVLNDGSSAMTFGVYFDRYVEEAGVWRYRWRHWGLYYRGPVDLSAPLVDCPDYGPPPNLPGPDEPTFTRRPPQS